MINTTIRKMIKLLAAAMLTLAVLAACGSDGTGTAESAPVQAPAETDKETESSAAPTVEESEQEPAEDEQTQETAQDPAAPAEETSAEVSFDEMWDLSYVGIRLPMPAAYLENRDKVYIYPDAATLVGNDGTRAAIVRFILYPASEEALMEMDETAYDAITPGIEITNILAAMPDGKGADEFNDLIGEYGVKWDVTFSEPLGSAGNYTYYECIRPDSATSAGDPGEELLPVYEAVKEGLHASFQNAEFTDTIGSTAFSTTDLDGNPVDTGQLFSENKVTMINIWTTWCVYCIQEMPELQEIYEEYREKGGSVVGILMDADEEGALEEAENILAEAGVKYLTLKPTTAMENTFTPMAYPTTYFVDENGKILGDPIVGADVKGYRARLEEYLG